MPSDSFQLSRSLRLGLLIAGAVGLTIGVMAFQQAEAERRVNLEDIERSLVVKALTQARHNKTRAAKLLGLTRAQLYSRIEKYGLTGTES